MFHFSATEAGFPPLTPDLPQGSLTEMTNYTSSEVLNFLLHFIYPYGLHPSPPTCTLHPRWTRGSPPLLSRSATTQRNGIKSTCQNVFHLIYLTLLYDTGTSSLGWQIRHMQCGSISGRRDKIEKSIDLHATWEHQVLQAAIRIGHDGRPQCGRERYKQRAETWACRHTSHIDLILN